MRAEVAPPIARTIVGAGAPERGDARLDEAPLHREIAGSRFEHDERLIGSALSCAIQMETPPANVDQTSGRRYGRTRNGPRRSPKRERRDQDDVHALLYDLGVARVFLSCQGER